MMGSDVYRFRSFQDYFLFSAEHDMYGHRFERFGRIFRIDGPHVPENSEGRAKRQTPCSS